MNAYELADELEKVVFQSTYPLLFDKSADMLRQQADRIERKQELIREQTALLVKQNNRIAELEKSAEPAAWMHKESGQVFAGMGSPMKPNDFIPLYTTPQIKELSDKEIKPLLDRIQNYLECGGLFNPECIKHDKVRDLIMDCKAILKKASEK